MLPILTEAAYGRPPVADGDITVLPALPGPRHCVVAFTAHHVIAADIDEDMIRQRLDPRDLSQPMGAPFLLFLAGWFGASPGPIDVVMVAPQAGDEMPLHARTDLDDHPRVGRAARYRPELTVYADRAEGEPDAVLVIGRGVAGRLEMAYEVAPSARGLGLGRRIASAAGRFVDGEPLFAQVSPGNVASVRACLAAGYQVIGAEVLFSPH